MVDDIAIEAAKWIEEECHGLCIPMPCDGPHEYWEKETLTGKGLISMKHTAVNCGLGEMGKNTLLISPEYGNRLILGTILTNIKLQSDPIVEGVCIPGCRNCIEACPAQAIQGQSVNQKRCRENTYGKTSRGFGTVDCNKCRSICPKSLGNK